jgi:GAF domain-containing protein
MREAMDRQIDRLVYELYGLTEEEIEIVEENAAQCAAIARRQVLSFS